MIELHRAKMGIPTPSTQQNGTASAASPGSNPPSASIRANNQDERLHRFLTRLKHTKPTVPPSLTRRILNTQGVGYTDPLVSSVVSSAADRFLATVLSQALVCRDRRLKGEELTRKEKREIERVRKRRRAEHVKIEKKKRKLEGELEEMVKKGQKGPLKQDKKGSSELINLLQTKTFGDVGKKDCLDDEEDHYDKLDKSDDVNTDGADDGNDDDPEGKEDRGNQSYDEEESDEDEEYDDDDDREILQMRDLVRPLEAWGLSLTGKMGLATEPYIRSPKEKVANDQDEDNVGLEGEAEVADADDEDEEVVAAVEKTPTRKKKAGSKGSPATKKDGTASPGPQKGNI